MIVEGGSPVHRRLLEEIADGLGETELARLRLDDRDGEGLQLTLLQPEDQPRRTRWEFELAAEALRDLTTRDGLDPVVWAAYARGGRRLIDRELVEPLAHGDVARLRASIAAAVVSSGATLDRLEVLRPLGHAFALSIKVVEPHEFLRHRLPALMSELGAWVQACGGQRLVEIRDGGAEPVFAHACTRSGCEGGVRNDVACCDPLVWPSRGLRYVRPLCPVFD